MNLMNLLDLASLFFILGSLFSIAAVVRFQPSQLRLVADAALPIGLIGFLIGVISMLAAEADSSRIAPALAIAVLTVLYAGTIRLLLADTLNQAAPTEHSMTGKVLGSLGFLAMTAWAMVAVSPAGAIAFWDPLVALTLIGLAGLTLVVGRLFSTKHSSGWASKLNGLSWFGFTAGVVGALPHLDSPTSLGPAVAFAILSLLYTMVALILGLIWLPKAMPADDGSLPTGLSLAAPLVVLVSLMLAGLVLTVF